jgi:hypothetical protein
VTVDEVSISSRFDAMAAQSCCIVVKGSRIYDNVCHQSNASFDM